MNLPTQYFTAARVIKNSRALLITAGAGMGVDSGLPDFRGDKGFWNAYPMYEKLGISFINAANPANFTRDPAFAWGFYGHRLNLYRDTNPHVGFSILLNWAERYNLDYFVATSNVDGHFQKAGFSADKIFEVHGSIHYLQCMKPCGMSIWENKETIPVNSDNMRAEKMPGCPHCGGFARPNILMFADFSWVSERTADQERRFDAFVERNKKNSITVVEMGAGTAVPTIRLLSERVGNRYDGTVIRINPREYHISSPHIPLPVGALEGLRGIESVLTGNLNK